MAVEASMNHTARALRPLIVAALLLASTALPAEELEADDAALVAVRIAGLREAPGFLSPVIAELEYAAALLVVETRDDWVLVRVADTGGVGWLHRGEVAVDRAAGLIGRPDDAEVAGSPPSPPLRDGERVTLHRVDLRENPSFLAAIVYRYDEPTTVVVRQINDDWVLVEVADVHVRGWLHVSRLTAPGPSANSNGPSSREIALAPRPSFDGPDVEQAYAERHSLGFELVDEMESYELPVSNLVEFLRAAGLTVEAGLRLPPGHGTAEGAGEEASDRGP
jgi:hypothetical protein